MSIQEPAMPDPKKATSDTENEARIFKQEFQEAKDLVETTKPAWEFVSSTHGALPLG